MFETNLRREGQLEGIAKAKVAAVYRGRKPSIDVAKIEALKASDLGPTEVARKLKIGRASVYRVWGRNVQTLDRRVRRHFFAIVL
jgi:DNA invertase Pin-like site-specific DNA recombinase